MVCLVVLGGSCSSNEDDGGSASPFSSQTGVDDDPTMAEVGDDVLLFVMCRPSGSGTHMADVSTLRPENGTRC